MGAKQQVRDLLDRLPDNCSLDDVLYHIHVDVQDALRRRWHVSACE